jgi:CO/xanthine dehydrogenase FAD-binding subunit
MKYYRPETIEEAIKLLSEGVPLAGGTRLTPRRRSLEAVIDLDRLGMDQFSVEGDRVQIGAAAKLQDLVDLKTDLPDDLVKACRLEVAWNLRNMATFGGTVMSAEARSPLLVVLLALGTQVSIHGENPSVSLDEVLDRREEIDKTFLIEQISFDLPEALSYEFVARAPTDRPLVSAAAAFFPESKLPFAAIGGFGERPLLLEPGEGASSAVWRQLAAEKYAEAGDAFASAEYRSEIVATLVERVVEEVQS